MQTTEKKSNNHASKVNCVSITPEGRYAISGGCDKQIRFWQPNTGECLRVLEGHEEEIGGIKMTSDARVAVSADGTGAKPVLRVWNLSDGTVINILKGHTAGIKCVNLTPDGRFAVSGGADKSIRLWNTQNAQCLKVLQGHTDTVSQVGITPDGQAVASIGRDGTFRRWNMLDNENPSVFDFGGLLAEQYRHQGKDEPETRAFVKGTSLWGIGKANGKMFAIMSSGRSLVFCGENRNWLVEAHSDNVSAVAATQDSNFVLTGSRDRTLKLWSVDQQRCLCTFTCDRPVTCCAISQDHQIIVAGDEAGGVHCLQLALP